MGKNEKICSCCGNSKSNAQFHKSPVNPNTFLPLCKLCCRERLKKYKEILCKESAAMWMVLAQLDVPFFSEIWEQVKQFKDKSGPNTDLVMAYLRFLNEYGMVVQGFWESDTMLDMLIDTNIKRKEQEDLDLDITQEIKQWGRFVDDDGNIDIEAYEFLNETFNDYTNEIQNLDANLVKRYRDLAKAELRKRQADESGDIQEIAKAQDNLKKMLDMLQLSDFKPQEVDERKRFIDRIAWMIEETEPAEEEDEEKYRDIAGYEKIYNSWMRSMRNLLLGERVYPEVPEEEK